jgi:hypothetical protein
MKKEERETFHELDALIKEAQSRAVDELGTKRLPRRVKNLLTHRGIKQLVELLSVNIHHEAGESSALVSFDFNCDWDDEHGMALLLNRDQVLEVGGIAEFCSR